MTVEEAVRLRILALPAVTAIVGSRVYLDKLPQSSAYPTVLVQVVSEQTDYQLRGESGVRRARVQVDAYARETSGTDPYAVIAQLAEAINGAGDGSGLSGWRGMVGSPDFEVLAVQRAERARGYDADELFLLRMRQDYWVTYRM